MSKTIGVKLALKDQFTNPLKKAKENTKAMNREVKKMQNSIKSFSVSLKRMAKWGAIGFAGLSAGIVAFSKSSIEAAKVQIEQETKLSAVLKNTKGMRDEQIESIKKYASELQNIGVIGDEVALAGVQQLGSYQLQSETLKKLMPGMQDLIAQQKGLNATTGDAVNIGNMLGKVMTGQVGALSRAGINFNKAQEKILKFGKEEEKAAVLSQVLKQNVGGVNKALRQTDQGKIQAMTNAWGDMKEELGRKLLPYLGEIAGWFADKIPIIQIKILNIADKIVEMINKSRPYIEKFKEVLGSIFKTVNPALIQFGKILLESGKVVLDTAFLIVKNWDRVSPIFYTLTAAITAYKAVIIASKIPIAALAIKQWALNVALSANPIGLVVAGIASLIGVGWLLYKNWDLIKAKAKELWNMMGPVKGILEFISNVIKDYVILQFNRLKAVINAILHPIEAVKRAFTGLLDKVKSWNNTEVKDKDFKITENKITNTENNMKYRRGVIGVQRVPRHALGTTYFKGGVTGINEGGRNETAILPSGTKILSHEQGKTEKTYPSFNINLNISGNVIGNKQFIEECGNHIMNKIMLTLYNT